MDFHKKLIVIAIEAFIIAFISLLIGLSLNFSFISDVISGKKVLTLSDEDTEVSSLAPIIHLAKAKEVFDSKSALFIDARSVENYIDGHIPGAINLPSNSFGEKLRLVVEKIPIDMAVVTYCSGSGCDSSIYLANYLVELGFSNVMVFYGGWPEWMQAGYPINVGY